MITILKKYKYVIIGVLILLLFYFPVKEGFTSCTQAKADCSTCTSAMVNGSSSGCYWNPYDNSCGSFGDPGYYKTCSSIPDPLPDNPNKPTNPDNPNNYNTTVKSRILSRVK